MVGFAEIAPALTGLGTRLQHGPPPADLAGYVAWVEDRFPIIVRWSDALPTGADGAYRAVDESDIPTLTGIILLRPGLADARWVLSHELGHALTGCQVGYHLWSDGRYHSNVDAECAANQCAATLLLDVYEVRRQVRRDWRLSDIARHHGVTTDAVVLRLDLGILLGEYRPGRIDRHQRRMATGER